MYRGIRQPLGTYELLKWPKYYLHHKGSIFCFLKRTLKVYKYQVNENFKRY